MSIDKYPSPREKFEFTEYWEKYIDGICSRDNFKVEHLDQLKVLCDLFVEHDEYIEYFETHDRTYISVGRNGDQIKVHPLMSQLNRVRAEIRNYTKALGIVLFKDTDTGEEEEKDEWD